MRLRKPKRKVSELLQAIATGPRDEAIRAAEILEANEEEALACAGLMAEQVERAVNLCQELFGGDVHADDRRSHGQEIGALAVGLNAKPGDACLACANPNIFVK